MDLYPITPVDDSIVPGDDGNFHITISVPGTLIPSQITGVIPITPPFAMGKQVWQARGLRWRWIKIGRRALAALPIYLFPAWLMRWTWAGYLMGAIIMAGYGNIKYQLLTLLFVFPII